MAEIRKSYVDCRFGQMHVRTAGEGPEHPLVCLHMSPYSGDYYHYFQLAMATDRPVLCPDTPGYGGSDRPSVKPGIRDYAAAVLDLMDAHHLNSVDLLGFHAGAFIAADLAVLAPERIRRLVLPGIPLVDTDRRSALKEAYAKPRPYFEEEGYLDKRWQVGLKARGGMSDARFLAQYADSLRAGADTANWGFEAVFAYDPEAQLPRVAQPVLVPVPDEALADNSRRAAGLFPNARLEDWPDLKGDLFECHAEKVAERIRPFLGT